MNKDAAFLAEAYQTVVEKKAKPDFLDVDKDGDKKESMKKALKDKKKSVHKENAEMAGAYETILEFRQINKRFARRYNKVTAAMLKAQPGSEEYGKLKSEREDLVTILKDHGQTPKDLEAFLVKKEKENPLPDIQDPQSMNQYKDSSYTDTADIPPSEGEYEADMNTPQVEVSQMPPDAPAPQEVQAVQAQ
jgi:16S rRNA C967 or C1407 C5-methylase (RsmB/RsmF family)